MSDDSWLPKDWNNPEAWGSGASTSTEWLSPWGWGIKNEPDPSRNFDGARIKFYSISQGYTISFKAFVTNFSDKYECNWTETRAFGRMDPLTTYQGTGRKIAIEWDIPSYSLGEARRNLNNCSKLIRAMYPSYAGDAGVSTLQTPPYFKVKFMNLISNSRGSEGGSAGESGLFCTIAGFDFNPDLEAGVYVKGAAIFPKVIKANIEMTILHDHLVGRGGAAGTYDFTSFPYSQNLSAEQLESLKAGTFGAMASLAGAGVAADAAAYSATTGIEHSTAMAMETEAKNFADLAALGAFGPSSQTEEQTNAALDKLMEGGLANLRKNSLFK